MSNITQQHELLVQNPQKVYGLMDDTVDILKYLENIIQVTSDISKMNLSIGVVNAGFAELTKLADKLKVAEGDVVKLKADIEDAVAKLNKIHDNMEF